MEIDQIDQVNEEEAQEIQEHGAVEESHRDVPDGTTMKMDLHCHSEASWDCITPLKDILDKCRKEGIKVQAITDHNEIWGAKTLKTMAENDPDCDVTIIVGEEITTTEGEIIGLFLEEQIEAGLTPEETVRRIRANNGLVLLPHGFDPLKRYRLRPEARERIAGELDIIETFNARVSRPHWNQVAVDWAEKHNLILSAGSDAHRLADVGAAWVEVPRLAIQGPEDLLLALKGGVPVGKWTHPVWAFVLKMWGWVKKLIGFS
jgi:predicted metal-dependent phosphoesterase TrpH